MHSNKAMTWACTLVVASLSVACDNREPCDRAEEELNAAAADCGLSEDYDLSCYENDGASYNCDAYYANVADTARCEDGEVRFEYGPACT